MKIIVFHIFLHKSIVAIERHFLNTSFNFRHSEPTSHILYI